MPEIKFQFLRIPTGWSIVWNTFYEECGSEYLVQDLLQVKHEEKQLILDLGWQPEGDPNGSFHMTMIRNEDWKHPILEFSSRDRKEVVAKIEQLLQTI